MRVCVGKGKKQRPAGRRTAPPYPATIPAKRRGPWAGRLLPCPPAAHLRAARGHHHQHAAIIAPGPSGEPAVARTFPAASGGDTARNPATVYELSPTDACARLAWKGFRCNRPRSNSLPRLCGCFERPATRWLSPARACLPPLAFPISAAAAPACGNMPTRWRWPRWPAFGASRKHSTNGFAHWRSGCSWRNPTPATTRWQRLSAPDSWQRSSPRT